MARKALIMNFLQLPEGRVRKTPDGRVAVLDAIQVTTGQTNPRTLWGRLKKQHPEIVTKCDNFKFPGSRGAPTPVINKTGYLYLLGLLPGIAGQEYREDAATLVLRCFEADPTLAEDIIDRQDDPEILHRLALRAKSIGVRKTFTDNLKIRGAVVQGRTNTYAQCTGLINHGVTGRQSKQIQAYTGIKKTRDALPSQYLSMMIAAEELTTASLQKNHAFGHQELLRITAIVAEDIAALREKHGIADWPGEAA